MSAKLTIIFFILICFEVGALLVLLPWIAYPSWSENYLLFIAAEKLAWPGLATTVRSGYFRGAVSGLGLLNILLGVWEVIHFKKTVRSFQSELNHEEPDSQSTQPIGISDNRPTGAPAQK